MAKLDHISADETRRRLQSALAEGALPGEREGFDDTAASTAADFMARALSARDPASPVIIVERASGRDNKTSGRSLRIALVNDDMPFLVDSIANCLAAEGVVIRRLMHPVLGVERDAGGALVRIIPKDSPGARRESAIFIEVDQVTSRQTERLEAALRTTLAHVRAAVTDWARMQEALAADAERVMDDESASLLRWLLDRNFTQIGHQLCRRDGSTEAALGICALKGVEPLLAPASIEAAYAWFEEGGRTPLVVKSNQSSKVHRSSLIDLFIVPVREGKTISALSIHAGMWTSAALSASPDRVPILRAALSDLMDKHHFDAPSHAGKALFHALTALPHDILIGFDRATLERLALTFMSLADRPRPKLVLAAAPLARHLYAFVWLPRDEVSTGRRVAIQDMLKQAANAPLLSWSIALEEGGLALLRITLDLRVGGKTPDEELLDKQLKHMVRGWAPAVESAMANRVDAASAARLAEIYADAFPQGYRLGAGPEEAAIDIAELVQLSDANGTRVRFYRNEGDKTDQLRLKLYSSAPIALSDAVPAFENFGFKAIEEVTTPVGQGKLGHIHRFLLARHDGGDAAALMERAGLLQDALAQVIAGQAEDDGFNGLIVSAELNPQSVVLVRALFRYLKQAGMPYALSTVVDALRKQQHITRGLVHLFHVLHDPAFEGDRAAVAHGTDEGIVASLAQVTSIDEDRIIRLFQAVIHACLRTNFFVESGRQALAFKLDSAKVPGLPKPLPWREIWVYSRRLEGIHLRSGPVARGGLRWSDRRDDFRTEILGLMKAQRVKNAVIVPAGAKGGFYPKQLPSAAVNRDAWLAEGTESYRIFIRSLLSVTDNIVGGAVTHPDGMIVHDGADPYFVVAADKGTATFSDVANAIALERGFWLGDAFASGGSNGYDHKAMGITARGAWLSVQRHFAEMGVDVQSQSVRVVGVGDMSGDVFGNGMLLSKALKLVAAFDHRHIFIDPDPDPASSWAERDRLFKLPRSSWEDYDKALISQGGGVFPRSLKSIPLSPEMKTLLDVAEDALDPASLMSAILRAQADLLWFGGIGTYVKAASQSNAEAGDTANDAIRVNADELRVKVVGEGANLGVTQAARIAYSLNGGRINTDFIDNSAGVDCSDNEVNIKIALNQEMADGRLSLEDRNSLLVSMTDAVADLVLEDNRLQALGLSIAESGGVKAVPGYIRLIETFEESGTLDRKVEGLAANDQLLRRAADGKGLTRPELAVLLSTAKLTLQDAIEQGTLVNDPAMGADLAAAFPPQMQSSEADAIAGHQLRKEIIATKLANRIINRLGLVHPYELTEEEGCTLADMASAFVVADRLFGVSALWSEIDSTDMPEAGRLELLGLVATAMRSHMAAIIRELPTGFTPAKGIERLRPGVEQMAGQVDAILTESLLLRAATMEDDLEILGVPGSLAQRTSHLYEMEGIIGIASLTARMGGDVVGITGAVIRLGEATGIHWLHSAAAKIEPSDPWERQLLSGLVHEMQSARLELIARLGVENIGDRVDTWLAQQAPRIAQLHHQLARAQNAPAPTVAMLAELAGQARMLMSR